MRRPVPLKPSRTPMSLWRRLVTACTASLLGALIGGGLDVLLAVLRALAQPHSAGGFNWFLLPLLAGLGGVLGLMLGSRAGEFFGQLFNPAAHDSGPGSASWVLRLLARALAIVLVLWGLLLVLSP